MKYVSGDTSNKYIDVVLGQTTTPGYLYRDKVQVGGGYRYIFEALVKLVYLTTGENEYV